MGWGLIYYLSVCIAGLVLIYYAFKVAVDRKNKRLDNFKERHDRKDINFKR